MFFLWFLSLHDIIMFRLGVAAIVGIVGVYGGGGFSFGSLEFSYRVWVFYFFFICLYTCSGVKPALIFFVSFSYPIGFVCSVGLRSFSTKKG